MISRWPQHYLAAQFPRLLRVPVAWMKGKLFFKFLLLIFLFKQRRGGERAEVLHSRVNENRRNDRNFWMPCTKNKEWRRILKFGHWFRIYENIQRNWFLLYTLLSFLKSWSSKRASFPFSNAEYLHRLQEFCVCISSPWPVLKRFFGGFYDGVEKPSLDFIVLNEIV